MSQKSVISQGYQLVGEGDKLARLDLETNIKLEDIDRNHRIDKTRWRLMRILDAPEEMEDDDILETVHTYLFPNLVKANVREILFIEWEKHIFLWNKHSQKEFFTKFEALYLSFLEQFSVHDIETLLREWIQPSDFLEIFKKYMVAELSIFLNDINLSDLFPTNHLQWNIQGGIAGWCRAWINLFSMLRLQEHISPYMKWRNVEYNWDEINTYIRRTRDDRSFGVNFIEEAVWEKRTFLDPYNTLLNHSRDLPLPSKRETRLSNWVMCPGVSKEIMDKLREIVYNFYDLYYCEYLKGIYFIDQQSGHEVPYYDLTGIAIDDKSEADDQEDGIMTSPIWNTNMTYETENPQLLMLDIWRQLPINQLVFLGIPVDAWYSPFSGETGEPRFLFQLKETRT